MNPANHCIAHLVLMTDIQGREPAPDSYFCRSNAGRVRGIATSHGGPVSLPVCLVSDQDEAAQLIARSLELFSELECQEVECSVAEGRVYGKKLSNGDQWLEDARRQAIVRELRAGWRMRASGTEFYYLEITRDLPRLRGSRLRQSLLSVWVQVDSRGQSRLISPEMDFIAQYEMMGLTQVPIVCWASESGVVVLVWQPGYESTSYAMLGRGQHAGHGCARPVPKGLLAGSRERHLARHLAYFCKTKPATCRIRRGSGHKRLACRSSGMYL